MATSRSKRKRSRNRARPLLENPEIDGVFTEVIKHLHSWTQKEIFRLNSSGNIVILPGKTKNHYTIGKYQLLRQNDHCWTVLDDHDKIQDFHDRRSAVIYCMRSHNRYSKQAEEIRVLDALVGKLVQDQANYQHTADVARRNKNWILYDAVQARISEISSKLEYAQDQLEKSLKWAKYKKTQDQTHETTRIRN